MEDGTLLRKLLSSHWADLSPLEVKLFLTLYWLADSDSYEATIPLFQLARQMNTLTSLLMPHLERLKFRKLISSVNDQPTLFDTRFKILCDNGALQEHKGEANTLNVNVSNDNVSFNDKRSNEINLNKNVTVNGTHVQRQWENNSNFASFELTATFIAKQLDDEKNLALYEAYLKRYPQTIIRKAFQQVLRTPPHCIKKSFGAYFTFLVKKYGNN